MARPKPTVANRRKFVLVHHRSPGDIVCMTSLVRDVKLTYGDQVLLDVDTTCKDLWRHNPHITPLWDPKKKRTLQPGVNFLKLTYGPGLRQQNHETVHFAAYFHRDFKKQTSLDVPVLFPHGDLHLNHEEQTVPIVQGRYWVMLSGGKSDFTIKVWRTQYFQEVADWLATQGLGTVQLGSTDGGHWHPNLDGTLNLVGRTNLRDMIRLIHHADGVICGITGAMHMAAALHRPCVCIAGGREAWWWEAYVNENKGFGEASGQHPMPHKFLHTIGLLDCCRHHGCWKNKVVSINDDKLICKLPVIRPDMPVAQCMDMIQPRHVMEAIVSYYQDGSLPPVKLGKLPEQPAPSLPKAASSPAPVQQEDTGGGCNGAGGGQLVHKRASARLRLPPGMIINPDALMEGRGSAKQVPLTDIPQRPGVNQQFADDRAFDHQDVGGKFTAFILFYGGAEFYDLHQRCLETLMATMPAGRMELRVGSNQLNNKSLQLIEKHVQAGTITKHYQHPGNDYKYPVMREMFFDPTLPIKTKWVLWFDDDSICDSDPNWANVLAQHIAKHHKSENAHMMGAKFTLTPSAQQWAVMESRPWHRGRPRRLRDGSPSPSGQHIIFATGGFWAITHEAIIKADIPDLGTGLSHNGGDWQIGEQIYQAGFSIKQFNGKKQFVRTSSVPRRGVTTNLIGDTTTSAVTIPPAAPRQPALRVPPPMPSRKTALPQKRLRRIMDI